MSDATFSVATLARSRLGPCGGKDGVWILECSMDRTADSRDLWCPTAVEAGSGSSAASSDRVRHSVSLVESGRHARSRARRLDHASLGTEDVEFRPARSAPHN